MKKYKDHAYADCPEPNKHHRAGHRLIPTEQPNPTHTPTPWRASKFNDTKATTIYSEILQGTSLGYMKRPEDAAFIVHAVNSHKALLAMAKYYHQSDDPSFKIHQRVMPDCQDCKTIREAEGR